MHTCAYYVDGRPGAMPVLSTCAQGRVMSCCDWQAQQVIGTARPPAPLRQEAEVGGAAPGAGEGGWCEKTTKNLVKGVGMYAARCARHVSVARASTPCYFSCRLAVRVPREEHTVRRFSRGGLSSPVCRRCGCGISYLLTYRCLGLGAWARPTTSYQAMCYVCSLQRRELADRCQ